MRETQCAFQRIVVGLPQIEHHGAVQASVRCFGIGFALAGLQGVGNARMAEFVIEYDAFALAQYIGGDIAQIAQVSAIGCGRHRRVTAIALQQQHHSRTRAHQGLAQHHQPRAAQLLGILRLRQPQPTVAIDDGRIGQNILCRQCHGAGSLRDPV